jgi:hypothetical protein
MQHDKFQKGTGRGPHRASASLSNYLLSITPHWVFGGTLRVVSRGGLCLDCTLFPDDRASDNGYCFLLHYSHQYIKSTNKLTFGIALHKLHGELLPRANRQVSDAVWWPASAAQAGAAGVYRARSSA